MQFNPDRFESLLGGSHVGFKKREHPSLSEEEREFKVENERKLQDGIRFLRILRTEALEAKDPIACQNILGEAHRLASQIADVIISQAQGEKPLPIDSAFLGVLQRARDAHAHKDAGSGHGIPPQFSVQNLLRAVDDMLVRIEEKVKSLEMPDHKLSEEEMGNVLQEFLVGTNDLTINAKKKFFEKNMKIAGILSGGSVYLEMVKKITEKYGDPSLAVNSFVLAVDKEKNTVAVEANKSDVSTQNVIITDDMIDKGGTMISALWATGEHFPNARIYSGKGTDEPGGFANRRDEKFMSHLTMLFQDFAAFEEAGRDSDALDLFEQAEEYAKTNNVTLQRGWYKRKERIDKKTKI